MRKDSQTRAAAAARWRTVKHTSDLTGYRTGTHARSSVRAKNVLRGNEPVGLQQPARLPAGAGRTCRWDGTCHERTESCHGCEAIQCVSLGARGACAGHNRSPRYSQDLSMFDASETSSANTSTPTIYNVEVQYACSVGEGRMDKT